MKLATLLFLPAVAAQFGFGPPGGGETFEPIKGDLKHVRCGVCRAAAHELHAQASALHAAALRQQADESEMHDLVDGICNKETESWMSQYDIYSTPEGFTEVRKMDAPGRCKRECATVARSCQDTLEDHDLESVVVALWRKEADADAVATLLCDEAASVCGRKPKKPKKAREDEEFEEMSEEDLQMEEFMRAMRASGQNPGIMNPEDMGMGGYGGYGDYGDEYGMGAGGFGGYDTYGDYGDLYAESDL